MAMTLAEIDAAIAELEAARQTRLIGKQRAEVSYTSGRVRFAEVPVAEISAEIARLKVQRAKLTGEASGVAIPEKDYPQLASLNGCIEYLSERTAAAAC